MIEMWPNWIIVTMCGLEKDNISSCVDHIRPKQKKAPNVD